MALFEIRVAAVMFAPGGRAKAVVDYFTITGNVEMV